MATLRQASQLFYGDSSDEKSATWSTGADATSLLYNVLPPLIQRRVPRIRSLRRTASNYGKSHTRDNSDVSTSSVSPPPSYRTGSRPSSAAFELDEAGTPEPFHSLPGSRPPSRPSSSGSTTPTYVEDADSGLKWKYASQGYNLLSLSAQEATSVTQAPQFSRRLYIDGLAYLLRGLPTDLTVEEEHSLRAALPDNLSLPTLASKQLVLRSQESAAAHSSAASPAEPSLLHRFTANVVLYAFLAINFLLPYVQLLIRRIYQYDRKHHISDRLFQQAVVSADVVGKHTVALANTVCNMNDGVVGERMREAGVWWVQGVTGGAYEGLGEGMEVLGLKAAPSQGRVKEVAQ